MSDASVGTALAAYNLQLSMFSKLVEKGVFTFDDVGDVVDAALFRLEKAQVANPSLVQVLTLERKNLETFLKGLAGIPR